MKKDENNKIKTKTKQKIKENRMKKKDAIFFFFFFLFGSYFCFISNVSEMDRLKQSLKTNVTKKANISRTKIHIAKM